MTITYDDTLHEYRANGVVVPSVTQIIKRAGLSDMSFVPLEALDRGTRVHAEIAEWLTCDWLHGQPTGHLAQVIRFLSDTNADVLHVERIVYHRGLKYAGRIDLIVRIGGRIWILDFKLNSTYAGVGPQLAAYRAAFNHGRRRGLVEKIGAVVLTETSYRLHDFGSGEYEWGQFREALRNAGIRNHAGIVATRRTTSRSEAASDRNIADGGICKVECKKDGDWCEDSEVGARKSNDEIGA